MIYNKGFTYLGLIIVLLVILFLCSKAFNVYFKKTSALTQQAQKSAIPKEDLITPSPGLDPGNYQVILETTKNKINDFEKQRAKTLEGID